MQQEPYAHRHRRATVKLVRGRLDDHARGAVRREERRREWAAERVRREVEHRLREEAPVEVDHRYGAGQRICAVSFLQE